MPRSPHFQQQAVLGETDAAERPPAASRWGRPAPCGAPPAIVPPGLRNALPLFRFRFQPGGRCCGKRNWAVQESLRVPPCQCGSSWRAGVSAAARRKRRGESAGKGRGSVRSCRVGCPHRGPSGASRLPTGCSAAESLDSS